MTRTLVLSSGLTGAAYQIGALRHLVGERQMHFDLCAGSGFGAVHAAFVACGEFEALYDFWQHIGWRRLVAINWRSPWRDGPFTAGPLKAFLAAHLNLDKLARAGSQLRFVCLNLQTGRQEMVTFPGSTLPLVDALAAAVTIPGLMAPLRVRDQQWVDASYTNSFILRQVLRETTADDVWTIATSPAEPVVVQAPPRRYPHWRAVTDRALRLNQAHDVWLGLRAADQLSAAAVAHCHVRSQLPDRLANLVEDPRRREQLRAHVNDLFAQSTIPLPRTQGPTVHVITPSRPLTSSLWRFRQHEVAVALRLGYQDAKAAT